MIECNGDSYLSSKYAQAFCAAEAKIGKTCFILASLLGVMPQQAHGGVVDHPSHLHLITFDMAAAAGVKQFLLKTCKAPAEANQFRVYNMQEDVLKVSLSEKPWDYYLYNTYLATLRLIADRIRSSPGIHAVVVSSVTGLAQGLQRAIGGPPGLGSDKKGSAMDMAKWTGYGDQLTEIRSATHALDAHVVWEAHIDKRIQKGQQGETETEGTALRGQSGQSFPYNVAQVFRIRREYGMKVNGTECDSVYLDTRPSMEWVAGGRNFTEALQPRETDMMLAFHKLGLAVGRWGKKAKPKAAAAGAA